MKYYAIQFQNSKGRWTNSLAFPAKYTKAEAEAIIADTLLDTVFIVKYRSKETA